MLRWGRWRLIRLNRSRVLAHSGWLRGTRILLTAQHCAVKDQWE